MKIHEFAKHLELLAHLLRQLPNTELSPKLVPDLQGLFGSFAPSAKAPDTQTQQLPDDMEKKLARMSAAEIEAYLTSEEEGFTVANLNEFATRLGLISSKRQSKNALINVIARHFEAAQMHSIIRKAKPDDV